MSFNDAVSAIIMFYGTGTYDLRTKKGVKKCWKSNS
jgi:hypothetical protein